MLERYGYGELRTPMFEDYELFARTSGESSDVVQKEMYRFKDLGERDLALRPEFTAGVMRAYLEHGLGGRARVHRLWSMGPVFRYGRPQKGRYRQFSQLNCELVGSPAPGADVEMITLFVDLYEAWGFRDLTVLVNSVGQPATRRAYGDRLREWLAPVRAKLSADSQARLETNPLRVLDTKDEGDLALLRGEGWPGGHRGRCRACSTVARRRGPRALGRRARRARGRGRDATRSITASCAGSTTTRAPRSRCTTARSARRARSAAAAATTGSSRCWAARRRRASASRSGSTARCS